MILDEHKNNLNKLAPHINVDQLTHVDVTELTLEELKERRARFETLQAFCNDNASRTLFRLQSGEVIYGVALVYMNNGDVEFAEHVWRVEADGAHTDGTYQDAIHERQLSDSIKEVAYFEMFRFDLEGFTEIAQSIMGSHYKITAPKVEHFYHISGYEKYFVYKNS